VITAERAFVVPVPGGKLVGVRSARRQAGPEVVAEIAALAEVGEAAPGTAQAVAAEMRSLRLIWPSYFADPAAAPPMPADLRLSRDCYAGTFESIGAAQAADGLAGPDPAALVLAWSPR
jgi:hypothetical protein